MSTLQDFFKAGATQMGIFYPKNYVVAAFRDIDEAKIADRALRNNGFASDDVLAVPGSDILILIGQQHRESGIWGMLMRQVSRGIATGEIYNDEDIQRAEQGAGFLFAYCPKDQLKERAWKVIEPLHPIVARYYTFPGIEHLTGETEHAPKSGVPGSEK